MAYQTKVTLTDAEYAAFSTEAAQSGKALETLLHEVLAQHVYHSLPVSTPTLSRQDIQNYLYHAGITEHVPTNEPTLQEEDMERQRLAHLFGQGKPVSKMVIEDRGSY